MVLGKKVAREGQKIPLYATRLHIYTVVKIDLLLSFSICMRALSVYFCALSM